MTATKKLLSVLLSLLTAALLLAVAVLFLSLMGCDGSDTMGDVEPSMTLTPITPPPEESLYICHTPELDVATDAIGAAIDTWNGMIIDYDDEPIPRDQEDFLTVVLHELGHQLGIRRHIKGQGNVMFAMIPGFGGSKRHLSSHDMAALPDDAPPLIHDVHRDVCDVTIRWGDTRYTTSTGHVITAKCLSFGGAIVCHEERSWYFWQR